MENLGLSNPLDLSLLTCLIIGNSNQPIEFKHMIVELNIYQDIYSPVMTGSAFISDSTGFLDLLEFNGNEFIMMRFNKPGSDIIVEKTFRIYTVGGRILTKVNSENYVLYFCSEEMLISQNILISKSYIGNKISDIVKDILINILKVNPNKLFTQNIEETSGTKNIVIPKKSPFEALNWLCYYALSNQSQTIGAPYLFYENMLGYNFQSLQSLYKQTEYGTYTYETKNINLPNDPRVEDVEKARWRVISYDHVQNFNTLESTTNGTFANRLISVDTLRLRYNVKDYDYNTDFYKGSSLNKYGIITNSQDRFGNSANSYPESIVKLVPTNTGISNDPYISGHDASVREFGIENLLPYRTAQIAQLNTNKMKLVVAGDPYVKAGDTIIFNLPSMSTDINRDMDKFFSGKYLITAIRHKMDQENKFVTMMEICKESVTAPYASYKNDLNMWKEMRSR